MALEELTFQRLQQLRSPSSLNPPPLETSLPLPVHHWSTTASHHGPDPAFGVQDRKLQAGPTLGIQVSNVGFLQREQHNLSFLLHLPFPYQGFIHSAGCIWTHRAITSHQLQQRDSRATNTAFVRDRGPAPSLHHKTVTKSEQNCKVCSGLIWDRDLRKSKNHLTHSDHSGCAAARNIITESCNLAQRGAPAAQRARLLSSTSSEFINIPSKDSAITTFPGTWRWMIQRQNLN